MVLQNIMNGYMALNLWQKQVEEHGIIGIIQKL